MLDLEGEWMFVVLLVVDWCFIEICYYVFDVGGFVFVID